MSRKIAKFILKMSNWKYKDFPEVEKAIVIMAPHTSNRDFFLGKLYFSVYGRIPAILIKKEAFFWPFASLLKKMGGIPVDRGRRTGLTQMAIDSFKNANARFYLVITPEGTRSKTKNWKKGFIRIAREANVPVMLTYLDKKYRKLGFKEFLDMSGTDAEIMERLKKTYLGVTAINPDNFITGYEQD